MPNWCFNSLQVDGSKEDIAEFQEYVKGPEHSGENPGECELSFQKIIPCDGSYDGCIDAWGTKWSASDLQTDGYKNGLSYNFCTAWSPPTPIFRALAEKFPKLDMEMFSEEDGMGFACLIISKKGMVFEKESGFIDHWDEGTDESSQWGEPWLDDFVCNYGGTEAEWEAKCEAAESA